MLNLSLYIVENNQLDLGKVLVHIENVLEKLSMLKVKLY